MLCEILGNEHVLRYEIRETTYAYIGVNILILSRDWLNLRFIGVPRARIHEYKIYRLHSSKSVSLAQWLVSIYVDSRWITLTKKHSVFYLHRYST